MMAPPAPPLPLEPPLFLEGEPDLPDGWYVWYRARLFGPYRTRAGAWRATLRRWRRNRAGA